MNRRDFRREALARRDALPPERRAEESRALCRRLAEEPAVQAAAVLAAYAPMRSEPELWPFLEGLLERGSILLLPRSHAQGRLSFHAVSALSELRPGRYGVMEPPEGAEAWSAAAAQLLLVPGCAFDWQGGRMGYGGGYYDRVLAGLPRTCHTLGCCFVEQLVERVPMEAWDVPLQGIMTPLETRWR